MYTDILIIVNFIKQISIFSEGLQGLLLLLRPPLLELWQAEERNDCDVTRRFLPHPRRHHPLHDACHGHDPDAKQHWTGDCFTKHLYYHYLVDSKTRCLVWPSVWLLYMLLLELLQKVVLLVE